LKNKRKKSALTKETALLEGTGQNPHKQKRKLRREGELIFYG